MLRFSTANVQFLICHYREQCFKCECYIEFLKALLKHEGALKEDVCLDYIFMG